MSRQDMLYKLVGKTISMFVPIATATGQYKRRVEYLVVAAYPHHVLCERRCESGAVLRECFNTGTLITQGIGERR